MIALIPHRFLEALGAQQAHLVVQWLRDLIRGTQERWHSTEIQTGDYTARPSDLVYYNPTPSGGTMTITFPSAPEDGVEVATYNSEAVTTAVNIAAGAGDTVDFAATGTTSTNDYDFNVYTYSALHRNWSRLRGS